MIEVERYRELQRERAKVLGFNRLLPVNKDNYPVVAFEELWDRVKEAEYAFEDTTRGKKDLFLLSMLLDGVYNFEIPGQVFVQLTNAGPGTNAMLHFTSLATGPTAPLTEAAAEVFWFAFVKLGVQRITGYIPEFNKKVIRMATLMKMKFEGDMRKAFLYNSEYWDIHIYGILASEYKRRQNAIGINNN
jgi:hypothetical protein